MPPLECKKNLLAVGDPPRAQLGELTTLPQTPELVGRVWLPPPQDPYYPCCPPFGPQTLALRASHVTDMGVFASTNMMGWIRPCKIALRCGNLSLFVILQ